jgi:cyd operon protein YbgT
VGLSRHARQGHAKCIGTKSPLDVLNASRFDRDGEQAITQDSGASIMWYFSWILGIGLALGFGIINAMWLESRLETARIKVNTEREAAPGRTND